MNTGILKRYSLLNNCSKRGILLFLRFFPDHVEELCRWIRQYTDDMDMLGSIIDALKESALPAASDILKDIYGFPTTSSR